MQQNRKRFVGPVLVILLGVVWLFQAWEVMPGVDWMWTIGLAATGLVSWIAWGWNRVTFVLTPFFLIASASSILRQTGRLDGNREVALLTILFGVLLLLAQLMPVGKPSGSGSDSERAPALDPEQDSEGE